MLCDRRQARRRGRRGGSRTKRPRTKCVTHHAFAAASAVVKVPSFLRQQRAAHSPINEHVEHAREKVQITEPNNNTSRLSEKF